MMILIRRVLWSFMGLILAAGLGSCSSNGIKGIAEPPKVSVKHVEFGQFSFSGGTARLLLDVTNPNRFAIPVSGFDYGIQLNGVQVANGLQNQELTIKSGETETIDVPISLSFTNMLSMLPGLLKSGQLDYGLKGSVHLPWFNIPFQRSGQTRLR